MSSTLVRSTTTAARALTIAFASLALVGGAQAQGHGGGHGGGHSARGGGGWGHGGGHYGGRHGGWGGGPGWVWGGLGLGLGLGLAGYYASPWYVEPGYVYADPPVVYTDPQPVPRAVAPVPSSGPVVYPRSGQTAAKTDADSDACSQWAGAQRNATADASVFQRGFAACMDARGYTVR